MKLGPASALAVVLAAAALAAGCGGDDESSATTEWADGVCSAISTWTASLTSVTKSLVPSGSGNGLETAVADVKASTSTFADDLKSPRPARHRLRRTGEGDARQPRGPARGRLAKIESAAEDASGASGTLTAISRSAPTLVTMGSQVSSALSDLEGLDAKGELQAAFEDAESCKSLTSTTS